MMAVGAAVIVTLGAAFADQRALIFLRGREQAAEPAAGGSGGGFERYQGGARPQTAACFHAAMVTHQWSMRRYRRLRRPRPPASAQPPVPEAPRSCGASGPARAAARPRPRRGYGR